MGISPIDVKKNLKDSIIQSLKASEGFGKLSVMEAQIRLKTGFSSKTVQQIFNDMETLNLISIDRNKDDIILTKEGRDYDM